MLELAIFLSFANHVAGRRRKVRCIRLSEAAPVCRACEERHSTCTPQEYSSQSLRPFRVPSRQRISRLESKVSSLSKIVRDIEIKLGYIPTETPEAIADQTSGSEDSDDDVVSLSDAVTAEPSHLRSLFQNDWLSVDMQPHNKSSQDRKARLTANLTAIARHALQKLLPSREAVADIAVAAFEWLPLLKDLLPQPTIVKSKQEMLETYENMHEAEVDAISLAGWLVALAITALQGPHSSSQTRTYYQRWLEFSRVVAETVERTILCHDRLLGTIGGLGIALHVFRMQVLHFPCPVYYGVFITVKSN
jgi:hypothetical protein